MSPTNKLLKSLACLSFGLATLPGSAVVVWDEQSQGDLSGDRNAPTSLSLSVGSNDVLATSQGGDREYVTFAVPAGHFLNNVFLRAYSGGDGTAFFGMQTGTTLTEDPITANPANLLGYAHFGTVPANVGNDILPQIATGFGSQGFVPPLPASSYTVWLQQLGVASTYQLDFVITPVPEPIAAPLYGAGLLLGVWIIRRARR